MKKKKNKPRVFVKGPEESDPEALEKLEEEKKNHTKRNVIIIQKKRAIMRRKKRNSLNYLL